MEKRIEKGAGKYVRFLKDASRITEDKYAEIIGATENENPELRRSAYYLLGTIMDLNLLRKDRETFLEGYEAVLKTNQEMIKEAT